MQNIRYSDSERQSTSLVSLAGSSMPCANRGGCEVAQERAEVDNARMSWTKQCEGGDPPVKTCGSLGLPVGTLPLFGIRKRKRVPPDFDSNRAQDGAGIWLSDAVVEQVFSTGSPKEANLYVLPSSSSVIGKTQPMLF